MLCILTWGQVLLFRGTDPANEAKTVNKDFNKKMEDFLRRED